MTSPNKFFPNVQETERLVFRVASQSDARKSYRVDLEEKEGLGVCDCEDYRINKNANCKHLRYVRGYVACKLAQSVINCIKK